MLLYDTLHEQSFANRINGWEGRWLGWSMEPGSVIFPESPFRVECNAILNKNGRDVCADTKTWYHWPLMWGFVFSGACLIYYVLLLLHTYVQQQTASLRFLAGLSTTNHGLDSLSPCLLVAVRIQILILWTSPARRNWKPRSINGTPWPQSSYGLTLSRPFTSPSNTLFAWLAHPRSCNSLSNP